MNHQDDSFKSTTCRGERARLDRKLAAYLAATASGSFLADEAQAIVVSNSTVQPFGINGEVSIDFNGDGQLEWQIDHDRVNLNGNLLDYLQIDKNDINSELDPLPVDPLNDLAYQNFPLNGTNRNNDAGVLSFTNDLGDLGGYAVALKEGDVIGGSYDNPTGSFVPGTLWDWQEGSNFLNGGTYIRANRLIDEDMGQIDTDAGRAVTVPIGPQPEFPELDDFVGLNGEVRYLGVRVDLNDAAEPGLNSNNPVENPDFHAHHWYGWIGIRITNEADATGEVVGWGYETEQGVSIMAGQTAAALPGDYNGNGAVDAADYVVWRKNNGLMSGATPAQGDGTGDGKVTVEDYNFWRSNFGSGAGTGTALSAGAAVQAVPEPPSLVLSVLAGLAVIGVFIARRFRGRRMMAS
jgi:hypothetical protein